MAFNLAVGDRVRTTAVSTSVSPVEPARFTVPSGWPGTIVSVPNPAAPARTPVQAPGLEDSYGVRLDDPEGNFGFPGSMPFEAHEIEPI
ncbi:hypothetical protein [Streptomyces nigrescens]